MKTHESLGYIELNNAPDSDSIEFQASGIAESNGISFLLSGSGIGIGTKAKQQLPSIVSSNEGELKPYDNTTNGNVVVNEIYFEEDPRIYESDLNGGTHYGDVFKQKGRGILPIQFPSLESGCEDVSEGEDYSYNSNNSSFILNTSGEYSDEGGEKLTEEDISNISSFYDEMRLGDNREMASIMKYELVMQRCHLSKLPKTNTSLRTLDLAQNQLTEVPDEIGELRKLQHLSLWDNLITTVSLEIGSLVALKELDLNHNQLETLPYEISKLSNLKKLHLINNHIKNVPYAIWKLVYLQVLQIDMNAIVEIPSDIGYLTSLVELSLTNNLLTSLPDSISYLVHLRELNLSNNQLDRLPHNLNLLTQLQTINLEHNNLVTVPQQLFSVSFIFIVAGHFRSLICYYISSLLRIELSNNKLVVLPEEMGDLLSLVKLNCNNNKLRHIPCSIGKLTALRSLLLVNNNLRELPVELTNCVALVELLVDGNLLLSSIYQLGVSATRAHLTESSPQRHDLNTPPSPILHDWEIDWKDLKLGVLVGEGAFGRVYEGEWQGRLVAVKEVLGDLDDKTLHKFRREVGILSKLKPHPNLVTYHGACTQFPHLYIVMEYIVKGSLHDLLHNSAMVVGPELRLKFARGAAIGCHYLHCYEPPLTHRDLKTKNMLVTKDLNVKLSDFGLATFEDYSPQHTNDWMYAPFAAPEVLNKLPYSEKSDVFSFGVVLWELASRKIPFEGQRPEDIKQFVLGGGRLPIPQNCSRVYQQLIEDCWHQEATKRPTFMAIYLKLLQMSY